MTCATTSQYPNETAEAPVANSNRKSGENSHSSVRAIQPKGILDDMTALALVRPDCATSLRSPEQRPTSSRERRWTAPGFDREVAKEQVYKALCSAADAGQLCPTADDLRQLTGVASVSTTVSLMKSLEEEGRITVQRYQRSREVTIVETGKATRKPDNTTPHWRGLERDIPTISPAEVEHRKPEMSKLIFGEARRLNKTPVDFLLDLIIVGWDVWEERHPINAHPAKCDDA